METHEYDKMDAVEKDHWWFAAKRKYIAYALRRFVGPGKKVLDIGCGTGAIMEYVQSLGYTVEGVDMTESALQYCRKKQLTVLLGLAQALPHADNSFDVVIASDVLEHVEDHETAVKEIARILKPGGLLIATVPAHPRLYSYHDVALHHVRRYTKSEFKKVISSALEVKYLGWIHAVILLPAIIMRRVVRKNGSSHESDVQASSRIVNVVMGCVYAFEHAWLRVGGKLPFGLSLMVVAKKN